MLWQVFFENLSLLDVILRKVLKFFSCAPDGFKKRKKFCPRIGTIFKHEQLTAQNSVPKIFGSVLDKGLTYLETINRDSAVSGY